ncbi:MAG: lipopolysaccharide biosynthesis protein [Mesorhizobium sp.]|uniref:lipopolysaccharide biosynthesis protein n=1 Tax=Mesorhizobium TaxID=68287 RepID=UPI000FE40A1B|nr:MULTISPECIES: lipopolysaccharide biosynthesis protein [Mesorhizobium]MCF6115291.1 lipopolysaccharide biosynthesis protein [Mesorhizobium muleiense]RWB94346.1 MAG: lipopolysaccharide biosynthesis protein [Mesorhizobium sp.]RWP02310.1 MAG: lipopolysaccharide biosynthesis protein [Mesorhizobium sp.]RWP30636.1 MAG: lipopolysaccharide biosynthesis protein [Mesorhizobium sp.]RWP63400.1 MAG: lipopolysaccharide biosynthesis protein [Mesorhizobium sp.]
MRFSAATTAGRFLPQRLALRAKPLLGRIDAVLFTADERGEASRMSLIAFSIRIVSAVIAFVSQVLMARWMGSFEYGIFVLVWVTMVIVGNLACLGFHTSIIRFIPEYRERNMLAELRGIVLTSRLFVMVASTAIAGLGALGVWLLSPFIENYYVVPFILGLICMPMIAMSDLLQGLARANSWALFALAPTYLVRPVLILALMVLMLLVGFAPDARTAIFASIAATYATTLGQLIGITARIGKKIPAGPRKLHFAQWFLVSLPIFLVEGFFFLLTNADVLMVGAYMNPNDVAVYFATVKTLALVHFVYFAVKAGVAQRYAQFTHGEPEKLAAFARETVSWTFWPSLLMALLVLVLGEPMLSLFGPEFVAGYPLLFLLVFGVVARAAVGPCESLLTMSGNQNICAAVYAMTLALNIGLNLVLIPLFGLWGAAMATAFAMIFEAGALSFTVWRRLGIVMVIFVAAKGAA